MFTPDSSQQQIINISQGQHLVLAPPGCGKTQILSERIRIAHSEHGVPYGDMLCLTFTNRAARGMAERISQTISDSDIADLFVGNIHRYCIRILTAHELVPSNTSIIDDDDALSILSRLSNQDEELVIADFKKTHDLFDCIHFSQMMHQINKNHPKSIRLHPECLNKDDLNAMRIVCTAYRKEFTAETMNDMYEHADFYLTDIDHLQTGTYANYVAYRQQVRNTLTKLSLAHQYETYKREHNLMDFNEVLLRAYDSISEAKTSNEPEKQAFLEAIQRPWIQVDEVQDLNPLQMAIIDLISKNECILYLGDEQQAIFSFMGAKLSTLEMLRERCTPASDSEKAVKGIHHLAKNHRSPRYLLDIYNRYAEKVLGIDPAFLPQPTNNDQATDATRFIYANTMDDEVEKVARQAGEWLKQNPEETTAIVTLSNADADEISHQLTLYSLPHFKISGTDLFSTPDMKLLLAHFTAVQSDTNLIAWSRIMQGAKCIHTAYEARDIVHQLIATGISPSELMTSGTPPLTQQFVKAYETQDIVIFDTETTGLDTFRDDIIQIAAMRIRGEKVLGQFMVHIETEREIPAMLGDIVNPIIEERKTAEILSHEDALTRFADFANGSVLLAHNADFDINILKSNL
ncbi:MAG: UvrD-helicase domain-containing protein, partial [Prevotella sp.]|nr:UvrD-helicase domain-containing protein [Prevotella sp.]